MTGEEIRDLRGGGRGVKRVDAPAQGGNRSRQTPLLTLFADGGTLEGRGRPSEQSLREGVGVQIHAVAHEEQGPRRPSGPRGQAQRLEQARPLPIQGVQFLQKALQKVGCPETVGVRVAGTGSGSGLHFPAQREDASGLVCASRDLGRGLTKFAGVPGGLQDDLDDPVAGDHLDIAEGHEPLGHLAEGRCGRLHAPRCRGGQVEVDDDAPAVGYRVHRKHLAPFAVLQDRDGSGVRRNAGAEETWKMISLSRLRTWAPAGSGPGNIARAASAGTVRYRRSVGALGLARIAASLGRGFTSYLPHLAALDRSGGHPVAHQFHVDLPPVRPAPALPSGSR